MCVDFCCCAISLVQCLTGCKYSGFGSRGRRLAVLVLSAFCLRGLVISGDSFRWSSTSQAVVSYLVVAVVLPCYCLFAGYELYWIRCGWCLGLAFIVV